MKLAGTASRAALAIALLGFLVWRLGHVAPPELPPMGDADFPPVVPDTVAPRENYRAPDFETTDLQGRSVRLSALRGRAVFVNFWATWCVPCRRELPAIGRLAARAPEGVAILTIATDSKEPDVREMMRDSGIRFPVVLDGTGSLAAKYEVAGIPTTLLIDPRGIVVKRIVGPRAWDHPEFVAWMGRLAGPPSKDGVPPPARKPALTMEPPATPVPSGS